MSIEIASALRSQHKEQENVAISSLQLCFLWSVVISRDRVANCLHLSGFYFQEHDEKLRTGDNGGVDLFWFV